MALTVYATLMGLFHKGSDGQGVAPGDACKTPPPPPGVPAPYINLIFAKDLAKGSKSVKIDGEPTFLETTSEIKTSTGDEPGVGKGLVSQKVKGKGKAVKWNVTVKIEDKGVVCNGDQMTQNGNGTLPNCIDPAALTKFALALAAHGMLGVPCDPNNYKKKCRPSRKAVQRDAVNGKPCWECGSSSYRPGKTKLQGINVPGVQGKVKKEYMTHDHQPPLQLAWEMGGCHMQQSPDAFKKFFSTPESVKPHCRACACSQGGTVNKFVRDML